MSHLGATHLVDGRPSHQILAIEERFDSVTIAVAPQRVRTNAIAGLFALLTFAAMLWMLLMACALGKAEVSIWIRAAVIGLLAIPPLAVISLVISRMRKATNWRTITVGDGLVTLASGPIHAAQRTLQLSE